MTETMGLAIFGFACTLLGGAIGIVGSYLVAVRLARNHTRSIASSDLRKAFAPTLAIIYLSKKHGAMDDIPAPDVDTILRRTLRCHAVAIEEFRPFISQDQRAAYQEAWEKYRYEEKAWGQT